MAADFIEHCLDDLVVPQVHDWRAVSTERNPHDLRPVIRSPVSPFLTAERGGRDVLLGGLRHEVPAAPAQPFRPICLGDCQPNHHDVGMLELGQRAARRRGNRLEKPGGGPTRRCQHQSVERLVIDQPPLSVRLDRRCRSTGDTRGAPVNEVPAGGINEYGHTESRCSKDRRTGTHGFRRQAHRAGSE